MATTKKLKFKVGDVVVVDDKGVYDAGPVNGLRGLILDCDASSRQEYFLQFDVRVPNVTHGKDKMKYWVDEEDLKPYTMKALTADPKIGIGGAPTRATNLPEDPKERKKYPVASGVLDYFPDALVAVSHVSWNGNEQHNPGEPLHWARGKSMDQDDTIARHFLQRGTLDSDGQRHSAKLAWRALALLQLEIEEEQKTKNGDATSK